MSFAEPKKAAPKAAPEPEEAPPIPAPFSSEEDMEFTAATKQNMLGFAKPAEFAGIVVRPFATRKDLRQADVYRFPKFRDLIVDQKTCEQVAEKIVGPLKTISLKHEKTEVFRLSFGPACEITLKDPDKEGLAPERRLFIVSLHKEIFGFYFHFAPKAQSGDSADIRGFLKGLK